MEIPAFDQPLEVSLEGGEVVITGPDGLCASLTPEAARESARRLATAVARLPGGTMAKPIKSPWADEKELRNAPRRQIEIHR